MTVLITEAVKATGNGPEPARAAIVVACWRVKGPPVGPEMTAAPSKLGAITAGTDSKVPSRSNASKAQLGGSSGRRA